MRKPDVPQRRSLRAWLAAWAGILALTACAEPQAASKSALDDTLAALERRVEDMEARARSVDDIFTEEVEPIAHALTRMGGERVYAQRIAIALVREGRRARLDPRLLLAVMTVENPWLDSGAYSSVGAVGLMQVMPFHVGSWGCAGRDLTDPDTNICYGAKILANALERSDGDLDRALLRYNGCVRGTNTPDCHLYPSKVLAHPQLASMGL